MINTTAVKTFAVVSVQSSRVAAMLHVTVAGRFSTDRMAQDDFEEKSRDEKNPPSCFAIFLNPPVELWCRRDRFVPLQNRPAMASPSTVSRVDLFFDVISSTSIIAMCHSYDSLCRSGSSYTPL